MLKLRTFSKYLLNKIMMSPLRGPYTHVRGHCWSADLPRSVRPLNPPEASSSTMLLHEDGVPYKYPHSSHEDICSLGRYRFSQWKDKVFFSASDNSDPNTNKRLYQYSVAPWLFRRRLGYRNGTANVPCNHQLRDAGPEQLRDDVAYALNVGRGYLAKLRSLFPSLKGRKVLEVGPGINYGAVMVLACHGMFPVVADRFLAPWQEQYHRRFYAALADALASSESNVDVSPLRALVGANRYDEGVITCLSHALEKLPLADNSIDAVFSNAVAEHLFDLKQSFTQLFRITSPGGYGLHQVDFRDHRNFDRPLEYLLLEEQEFQSVATYSHFECGNRYRPDEMTIFIESAGFVVEQFLGNCFSTAEYLADFLPRLRAAKQSRYCHRPEEQLQVISGFYVLRKPSA